MTTTICFGTRTIAYPTLGGHFWAYANWARGFKRLGCTVLWLEAVPPNCGQRWIDSHVPILRQRLDDNGLTDDIVLAHESGERFPFALPERCVPLEAAHDAADLFVNQLYGFSAAGVGSFRRSALLDIDPGLLQIWMCNGAFAIAPHDRYFTIGETIGKSGSLIPDGGIDWLYTPPCVDTETWQVSSAPPDRSFTTLTHWYTDEWVVDRDTMYLNNKRESFLEFVTLPTLVGSTLEIAVSLTEHEIDDRTLLRTNGWHIADPGKVAGSPNEYREYVRGSRAEFSCAKPSCMRLQNAWISDRTLCYLASGKPAVVQNTGPSAFLPDAEGILRFRTIEDAVRAIEVVERDYDLHARAARALTVELFDARKVANALLERAL